MLRNTLHPSHILKITLTTVNKLGRGCGLAQINFCCFLSPHHFPLLFPNLEADLRVCTLSMLRAATSSHSASQIWRIKSRRKPKI